MTIYLIVFAGLLSFTNYIGSRVLMSLYALELGASALAVGLLISLYAVFPFAVSVYAGRLVDRVGSFQLMLLGNAGSIAGLAIPYFVQGMAALYVAAALLGLAFTFVSVAQQALVASLGDATQRPRNVALHIVRAMMPWLMRRIAGERLLSWSLCFAGATFVLFPFFEAAWMLMLLSFVLGLGLGVGQPLSIVMTYDRAPPARTGEALGIRFTVVNLVHLVIPLKFGGIAAALGVAPVFITNAALMFGGAWASGRRPREESVGPASDILLKQSRPQEKGKNRQ